MLFYRKRSRRTSLQTGCSCRPEKYLQTERNHSHEWCSEETKLSTGKYNTENTCHRILTFTGYIPEARGQIMFTGSDSNHDRRCQKEKWYCQLGYVSHSLGRNRLLFHFMVFAASIVFRKQWGSEFFRPAAHCRLDTVSVYRNLCTPTPGFDESFWREWRERNEDKNHWIFSFNTVLNTGNIDAGIHFMDGSHELLPVIISSLY